MRVSDVLTKSGYAYEEFVEHGTCEDARQVERYYTRYGQLLGSVWLLHGDDMHHEKHHRQAGNIRWSSISRRSPRTM